MIDVVSCLGLIQNLVTLGNLAMAHAKLRSIIYDAKRIIEAAFIFLNRSFFDFILGNGLHLHAKDENGTLIDSLRVDFDISFIL